MRAFYLFFILVLSTSNLSARIVDARDFSDIESHLEDVDLETWVLWDVDYTLIIPHDEIFRPGAYELEQELIKKFISGADAEDLHSTVLLEMEHEHMDSKLPAYIKALQEKGVCTFALTAAAAGEFGCIASMADWRLDCLKSLGFDFSGVFPDCKEVELTKKEAKRFSPVYREGILFSSRHPKGEVLVQFLKHLERRPKRVIFVDDNKKYLESVESHLEDLGVEVLCIHYRASEEMLSKLDPQLAEFQFRHLVEQGEWLSDEEARLELYGL